jgi:hypothetical protein
MLLTRLAHAPLSTAAHQRNRDADCGRRVISAAIAGRLWIVRRLSVPGRIGGVKPESCSDQKKVAPTAPFWKAAARSDVRDQMS